MFYDAHAAQMKAIKPYNTFNDIKENDTIYEVDIIENKINNKYVTNIETEENNVTEYNTIHIPIECPVENLEEQGGIQSILAKAFKSKGKTYTRYDSKTETIVHNNNQIKFTFKEDESITVYYGHESIYFDSRNNLVYCVDKRIAELIVDIISAKCEAQMRMFKHIFNGHGWNYARPQVKLR